VNGFALTSIAVNAIVCAGKLSANNATISVKIIFFILNIF
jgi:hypothetical protein